MAFITQLPVTIILLFLYMQFVSGNFPNDFGGLSGGGSDIPQIPDSLQFLSSGDDGVSYPLSQIQQLYQIQGKLPSFLEPQSVLQSLLGSLLPQAPTQSSTAGIHTTKGK
ncbi:hypothetical protein CHUAL_012744 [Chamberlinius hualienensis]